MALTTIDRARILMDLIQDGNVTDESLYTSLDKASGGDAVAIANAFIEDLGPVTDGDGNEIVSPTNAQKAQFYINKVRDFHRSTIVKSVKNPAVSQAIVDATAAGNTTADNILGEDEPIS